MSEINIEILMKLEPQVVELARNHLGDSYFLHKSVSDFYQSFLLLVGASDLMLEKNQAIAFLNCLQACRYEYHLGLVSLLRGHLTDSASYLRKSIEFCAFSIEIFRSPSAAEIWLKIGNSKSSLKRYRKHFEILKVIRRCENVAPGLLERYEHLSQYLVHASYGGIAHRAELTDKDVHTFAYFEVSESKESLAELTVAFFATLTTHLRLIRAIQCALAHRDAAFDHQNFFELYSPVFRAVEAEQERWTPFLISPENA
jgi:hypothetical protein